MKNLLLLLNQPFPIHYILNNRLKFVGGFSIFIVIFLLCYEPFGLSKLPQEDRAWVIIGYGAVCFLIFTVDTIYVPFILSNHFMEGNWKMYKHILLTLYTIGTVTTGVVFYNHFLGILKFDLNNFLYMLTRTVAIGIIPAIISTFLLYNIELQRNLKEAQKLQLAMETGNRKWVNPYKINKIVLTDVQGKELLNLKPEELLLVRSADNYIEVFWKEQDKVRHKLLRQTMKFVEDRLSQHIFFFRCHRTSIVNLMNIKNISGNSLGCKLLLEGLDEEVPVSRNNRDKLYELLTADASKN